MTPKAHPPHVFAASPLDRRSTLRHGPGPALAGSARTLLFAADRPFMEPLPDGRQRPARFAAEAAVALMEGVPPVHLGRDSTGVDLFAAQLADPLAMPPDGLIATDLRSLAMQGLADGDELAILAQARGLLHWHQRHRFCANCGAPTAASQSGYRRDCAACSAQHFPRTDPVVIVTVVRGTCVLLGRGAHFQPGMYSALAGFMEPGESIEDAARRELYEETGIRAGTLHYHSSQPWPFPSSLMIGLVGEALNDDIRIDPDEIEDARWFARDELEAMLAGTHPQGFTAPKPAAIAHHLVRAALRLIS